MRERKQLSKYSKRNSSFKPGKRARHEVRGHRPVGRGGLGFGHLLLRRRRRGVGELEVPAW